MTDHVDNSELKVSQRHVDDIAKQVEGMIADTTAGIHEAAKLLDPKNEESWAGPQAISQTLVRVTNMLSNTIADLASVCVTKQWQLFMERALHAEDEDDRYMYAVLQDLQDYLVANSVGLEATVENFGLTAGVFKQQIVERIANACKVCEMLVDGHRRMMALCTEFGIDHQKIVDGDKEALLQALRAAETKTGQKISPIIYKLLKLPTDAPTNDQVAATEQATNESIKDALGMG